MLMVQNKAPHREWSPGPAHLDSFRGGNVAEPETLFDDYSRRAAVVAEQEMTIDRHMRDGWDLKLWAGADKDTQPRQNFFARFTPQQKAAWEKAYQAENEAFLAAPPQGKDLTRWKYQRYVSDYLRCIQSVDDNVGRLLDYLDKNNLAENTVVIYSSDQGFYLGEHGWYDKRWIFEESLSTPLLVRWPGTTPPGSECRQMVSNLDFAETFLDVAGAAIPADMQGRSLLPLLRGDAVGDWRTDFYYHYYELGTHNVAAHYGVVTDRYKLVNYYRKLDENRQPVAIDQWDLMDRQVDPREMRSFIDDPGYAPIRERLGRQLQALREKLLVPAEE
jgi:arylsulfatase A-like enzyme